MIKHVKTTALPCERKVSIAIPRKRFYSCVPGVIPLSWPFLQRSKYELMKCRGFLKFQGGAILAYKKYPPFSGRVKCIILFQYGITYDSSR